MWQNLIPLLKPLAVLNQYSPTAGKLWSGTPISNALVGSKPQVKGTSTQAPPRNNYVMPQGISNLYSSPNRNTGSLYNDDAGSNFASSDSGGGGEEDYAAQQAYQAWRSAIDQANRIRSSGKATFDDLIKSVTGFRERAKTQFGDAGQQITNTAGEMLGTNARSAEELAGQGRAQGRALGLGDSSKFNRQQKVNANLASTQGSVLANRGENERANRGVYDERLGQADAREAEANSYLRNINDSASGVEAAGVDNYGSALDNLIRYQQQLAAINPLNAGSLQQYSPNLSGIQNTLGNILGAQANRQIPGGDMGNPALSPYDDYRKLLGR